MEFPADAIDIERPYRVQLEPGWNLVGLPLQTNLSTSALRFDRAGAWSGSPKRSRTAGFERVLRLRLRGGSYQEVKSLQPWQGFSGFGALWPMGATCLRERGHVGARGAALRGGADPGRGRRGGGG